MKKEAKPWGLMESYQAHKARFIQGKSTPSILDTDFKVKDNCPHKDLWTMQRLGLIEHTKRVGVRILPGRDA